MGDRRKLERTPGSPPGRGWGRGRALECQALRRKDAIAALQPRKVVGAGFLSSLLGLVHARALTHTHKPQTHRTHTRTLTHPGGRAGLLGRHLPVGGIANEP